MVWRALIFFLSQAKNQLNKNSTLEQAFTWPCQLAKRLHRNLKTVSSSETNINHNLKVVGSINHD
jgi:hypothetical protein